MSKKIIDSSTGMHISIDLLNEMLHKGEVATEETDNNDDNDFERIGKINVNVRLNDNLHWPKFWGIMEGKEHSFLNFFKQNHIVTTPG